MFVYCDDIPNKKKNKYWAKAVEDFSAVNQLLWQSCLPNGIEPCSSQQKKNNSNQLIDYRLKKSHEIFTQKSQKLKYYFYSR